MDIQTQVLTGRLSNADGTAITTGSVRFVLSGRDATTNGLVSAATVIDAAIQGDGSVALVLWPNTAGLRGTHYSVSLVNAAGNVVESFGIIQVGEAGPYTLADLINTGVSSAANTYWWNLTEQQYTDALAAVEFSTAQSALAAASAADAEGARDTAQTYRDTTLTYKDQAEGHATTAAAEAANAASAVTWQDLAGLTFAFSETIVDGMVYDTTQDYDGGAWRFNKKASWYQEDRTTGTYLGEYANETAARAGGGTTGDCYYATGNNLFYELSAGSGQTATTRAGSAEFPAVAYITAEAARVIIWDAQTGGMWMAFTRASTSYFASASSAVSALDMKNGYLIFGTSVGTREVNFNSEVALFRTVAGTNFCSNPISGRNSGNTFSGYVSPSLVNNAVNDVAITTLPNAPIDPSTGLPKPTIAVATDGGVSVIKDDGTVVDQVYGVNTITSVNWSGDEYTFAASNGISYIGPIPSSDYSSTSISAHVSALGGRSYFYTSSSQTIPAPLKAVTTLEDFSGSAMISLSGLTHLAENPTTPANGMVAYTTSDYSTGWMPGDIKGAWLASTDDTDLVGSGELVTNGTFDTDISGWTDASEGTGSTSWDASGALYLENPAGSTSEEGISYQVLTTVIGEPYTLSATRTGGSSVVQIGSGVSLSEFYQSSIGTGNVSGTFISTTTTTYITVRNYNSVTAAIVDNISVKLADQDRSVNANDLIVNGTVTKTAVATGAELVAYSGFSASDYLSQPYNSDLDFGTGDFCVMGWAKLNTANAHGILSRAVTTGGILLTTQTTTGNIDVWLSNTTTYVSALQAGKVKNQQWTFVVVRRSAGVLSIFVDSELAGSAANTTDLDYASATLRLGSRVDGVQFVNGGSLALWRISATAPTAEQIRKIYNDEKWVFQPGAQVTLNGSSDAVTALAHDKVTDLLHVGTSGGMSVFDGLVRVSEDATAVTTSISANDSRIVRQ